MIDENGAFDAVVFAGGGCRCFWQLGFWQVAAPELGLRPRRACGVSAGAAMVCAALLGRTEQTLALFKRATASNRKNAYPGNLLRGWPVFPHAEMYRAALLELIDQPALERLQREVDLRVAVGRPPPWAGHRLALGLGLACYLWDRRRGDPVHGGVAPRLGFGLEVVRVRTCPDPEALAELVLASSCTPPFTPALRRDGGPVVDGGLVEGAPLCGLDDEAERTLVFLSRRYGQRPPRLPHRVYVAPSRPVPVAKWDYTNPDALQLTFDLGQRDAETWLTRHR